MEEITNEQRLKFISSLFVTTGVQMTGKHSFRYCPPGFLNDHLRGPNFIDAVDNAINFCRQFDEFVSKQVEQKNQADKP